MMRPPGPGYPLPVARALQAARDAAPGTQQPALGLADALIYYTGAVAVGQYSRAVFTGEVEPDPTLNRSLRSLRRVLRGQWLLWAARGLEAAPHGGVEGLAEWYFTRAGGPVASAYGILLGIMRGKLAYAGDFGEREAASPRDLLELVDQYRIRLGKVGEAALSYEDLNLLSGSLVSGLRAAIENAPFLTEYQLYAPGERRLLMGLGPRPAMPPLSVPPGMEEVSTLLLYPPGEMPDYTKRPTPGEERQPLFPLDPLLAYLDCGACTAQRVAALQEISQGTSLYRGLDPECGHEIRIATEERTTC